MLKMQAISRTNTCILLKAHLDLHVLVFSMSNEKAPIQKPYLISKRWCPNDFPEKQPELCKNGTFCVFSI